MIDFRSFRTSIRCYCCTNFAGTHCKMAVDSNPDCVGNSSDDHTDIEKNNTDIVV